MEDRNIDKDNAGNNFQHTRNGRIWGGLFLLGIGIVLLVDRMGAGIPRWVFSWPMTLIVIGLFLGIRHSFRGGAWLVLLLIGGVFLFDQVNPDYSMRRYLWPILIMGVGAVMIFRPRRMTGCRRPDQWRFNASEQQPHPFMATPPPVDPTAPYSDAGKTGGSFAQGDFLDSTAVFGGIRKAFFSKDFRGGEAVS